MAVLKVVVALCLCTGLVTASHNGNNGTATTEHQLKELQEMVSDLQKHIQAQEQEQRTVLTKVVSMLIITTDELVQLKHNYTDELAQLQQNYTDELAKQQRNYTNELAELKKSNTDELAKQQQNYTEELAKLQKNYTEEHRNELGKLQHNFTHFENNISFLMKNISWIDSIGSTGREVAFEAFMVKAREGNQGRQFLANSMLLFSSIQYNQGGSWNSSNGVFTATVNGTYQFWIDLSVTDVEAVTVSMKRNGQDFGRAYQYSINPTGTTSVSLTSLTHLVEGDRVYFVADKHVTCWPKFCSCGGVLLHSSGFQ